MSSELVAEGLSPYSPEWESVPFNDRHFAMERRRKAGHKQEGGVHRVSVDLEYRTEFKVDLPALIAKNEEAYWSDAIMAKHDCTEEWERPEALIWDILTEDGVEVGGVTFQHPHMKDVGFSAPDVNFRWSKQDWLELIARHPEFDPEKRQIAGQEKLL